MRKTMQMQTGYVYPLNDYGCEIELNGRKITFNPIEERILLGICSTGVPLYPGPFIRMKGAETEDEINYVRYVFFNGHPCLGKKKFWLHEVEPIIKKGESYVIPDLFGYDIDFTVSYGTERYIIHMLHKGGDAISEQVSNCIRLHCEFYGIRPRLKRQEKTYAEDIAMIYMLIHGMNYMNFTADYRTLWFFKRNRLGGNGNPRYIRKANLKDLKGGLCFVGVFMAILVGLMLIGYWGSYFLLGPDWATCMSILLPIGVGALVYQIVGGAFV